MTKLSPQFQERLDAWRNKSKSGTKSSVSTSPQRPSKNHGDVASLEEWDEEIKRSQKPRR